MSERQHPQLPLPKPRSPKTLDAQILAHARAQAQPPPRHRPLAWTGGLASAAVLIAAVFVTQLSDSPTVQREEARGGGPVSVHGQADAVQAAPMQAESTSAARMRDADTLTAKSAPVAALAADAAPANEATAERLEQAPMTTATATFPPPEFAEIHALWQSGEQEPARQAYRALRQQCTQCAWPATLELALEAIAADSGEPVPPE